MSERKDRPEHEQDRGTKAEHGIGREDEGMEDLSKTHQTLTTIHQE